MYLWALSIWSQNNTLSFCQTQAQVPIPKLDWGSTTCNLQLTTTFRTGSSQVTYGVIEVSKVQIPNWVHYIWLAFELIIYVNQGLTLLTASLVYNSNPRDRMSPALVNIDNWLRQELKKSQASFVDRHLILSRKGLVRGSSIVMQLMKMWKKILQFFNRKLLGPPRVIT